MEEFAGLSTLNKEFLQTVRSVNVPGHGIYQVPRHVSRVDTQPQSRKGWHGWVVRWSGQSKFFSDVGHGGCEGALEAAKRHVQEHKPPEASRCKPDLGIRVVRKPSSRRQLFETYVEVGHPAGTKVQAHRRFYVGVDNTVTPERLEAAMKKARALRARWIAEHESREFLPKKKG